jgi:hypothetical protein
LELPYSWKIGLGTSGSILYYQVTPIARGTMRLLQPKRTMRLAKNFKHAEQRKNGLHAFNLQTAAIVAADIIEIDLINRQRIGTRALWAGLKSLFSRSCRV